MIAAGIGFRPDCTGAEIAALVARACRAAGLAPDLLAVPAFRARQAAGREAAALLSLPLLVVAPDVLAAMQPLCPTRSARAEAATGIASVAEGCALAAAGPGAVLRLARIASGSATCALAEAAGR